MPFKALLHRASNSAFGNASDPLGAAAPNAYSAVMSQAPSPIRPTDAEAIGESRNIVTLTITEFQECSATGAQQSRQFSDESANQLQAITTAIKRKARLCGNAEAR